MPGVAHALGVEVDLHAGDGHVGHPLPEQTEEGTLDPAVLTHQIGGPTEGERRVRAVDGGVGPVRGIAGSGASDNGRGLVG